MQKLILCATLKIHKLQFICRRRQATTAEAWLLSQWTSEVCASHGVWGNFVGGHSFIFMSMLLGWAYERGCKGLEDSCQREIWTWCHQRFRLWFGFSIVNFISGKKQDDLVEILEAEEDFQTSRTLLEEVLAEIGARVVWLPKFHPEFAPIECVYRFQI